MSIRVLFFASFADATGLRDAEVSAAECASVAEVWAYFRRDAPRLPELGSTVLCAVNQEYARPDAPVHDEDEIAFFPPVSGG